MLRPCWKIHPQKADFGRFSDDFWMRFEAPDGGPIGPKPFETNSWESVDMFCTSNDVISTSNGFCATIWKKLKIWRKIDFYAKIWKSAEKWKNSHFDHWCKTELDWGSSMAMRMVKHLKHVYFSCFFWKCNFGQHLGNTCCLNVA